MWEVTERENVFKGSIFQIGFSYHREHICTRVLTREQILEVKPKKEEKAVATGETSKKPKKQGVYAQLSLYLVTQRITKS